MCKKLLRKNYPANSKYLILYSSGMAHGPSYAELSRSGVAVAEWSKTPGWVLRSKVVGSIIPAFLTPDCRKSPQKSTRHPQPG